ncbi:MAG: DUF1674 domain-containing protein [Rickettsiales bacterium]|nr:DUF1674 domain-containing protein [Rickettsiales bacterium]
MSSSPLNSNEPKKPDSEPLAEKPEEAKEIGGRKGPDPTRYGDWEIGGKCVDF